MIEVGTHWKYNIGNIILIVVDNTMIREATADVPGVIVQRDVPGVIVKRIEFSNDKKIKIPVSTLVRFYTQLTPLEVELL